jgi:predicted NodU family carbamoyl transferase
MGARQGRRGSCESSGTGGERATSQVGKRVNRLDKLFGGPPRVPESKLTQREMDLARSVQEVCEEVMLRMARTLHRETGLKNLFRISCYCGNSRSKH